MSQIVRYRMVLLITLLVVGLAVACGSDPNSQATFDPDTGLHPAGWMPAGHSNAAALNIAGCTECHGADYGGGISGVSCRRCHLNTEGLPSCRTCHGFPPVTGKHAEHRPISDCLQCHPGTVGTPNHANAAVDLDLTVYNAKTGGPAAFAQPNCTGVSCHGGNTQDWVNGAPIDVNTQCTACHASGTTQYNGFFSGRHGTHLGQVECWECHDTGRLSLVHFNDLGTPQMTDAWSTIIPAANYTGRGITYGSCTINCHGQNHNPENW